MRSRRAVAATGLLVMLVGCTSEAPADRSADRPADRRGPTEGLDALTTSEPGSPEPTSTRTNDPLAAALGDEPRPPATAREAGRQLLAAERAIQDPGTGSRRLAAAGHTQALAVRTIADHPRWDRKVGRMLPPGLSRATVDNVAARRQFRSMHVSALATELPAWRIVDPLPAAELRGYYREAQRRYGVTWQYLAAINLVETGFGRIRGTSVAGAQGPMQFIPTTWDIYGEGGDIRDPHDAILAAARLLRANGFGSDRAGALYRYNNSPAYVRGVTLYARVMQRRPRAYLGYHQWPIYYLTRLGSIWLPEGYDETESIPVRRYLAHLG